MQRQRCLAKIPCKPSDARAGKLDRDVFTVLCAQAAIQARICPATAIHTASGSFLGRENNVLKGSKPGGDLGMRLIRDIHKFVYYT